MTVIDKTVTINASLAQVEAFMDLPERIPEWYVGIDSVVPEPGYPIEVGTTGQFVAKSAGLTVESKFTLTRREVNGADHIREFLIEGMMTGTNTWTLREEGDVTHLNVIVDYQLSGGVLGKIMDRLFVERTYDNNSEQSLQNLKSMIEA